MFGCHSYGDAMSRYLTDLDMAQVDLLHVKADLEISQLLQCVDQVTELLEKQKHVLPYVAENYAKDLAWAAHKLDKIADVTAKERSA